MTGCRRWYQETPCGLVIQIAGREFPAADEVRGAEAYCSLPSNLLMGFAANRGRYPDERLGNVDLWLRGYSGAKRDSEHDGTKAPSNIV